MKTITSAVIAILVAAIFVSSAMAKPWRWQGNQNNTYGWQLMTPEERTEHQTKLRSFTDYNACKEYVDEHHKQMAERAKEKGITPPVMRRNPCDKMKDKGILK
ncbi:hypothetical protein OR1_00606 [Geobacter sp. OR-1]|uniref:hypothetical protein n=1 Tax=Geobacter sp. OR-1 TaxID=1266765 RepID=UPI000541C8A3|nr:hypothetical protein [Geobacter sp. OR-1]GAM08335.1 hypothetical protein OR1_00606 [Geobacter sp. OR-1]